MVQGMDVQTDGGRPRLGVLIASTRPGRVGPSVARWFHKAAERHGGFDVEMIDLADEHLPIFDEPSHPRLQQYTKEHTRRWSARVDRMDAFAFVVPEYDYGMAPSLLNALVYLFREWNYKPVGFVSYGGVSAGTRGVQMAKLTVTSLKMAPMAEGVFIPFVPQFVNEEGAFVPNETTEQAATALLDEIARWEEALRGLRRSAREPQAAAAR